MESLRDRLNACQSAFMSIMVVLGSRVTAIVNLYAALIEGSSMYSRVTWHSFKWKRYPNTFKGEGQFSFNPRFTYNTNVIVFVSTRKRSHLTSPHMYWSSHEHLIKLDQGYPLRITSNCRDQFCESSLVRSFDPKLIGELYLCEQGPIVRRTCEQPREIFSRGRRTAGKEMYCRKTRLSISFDAQRPGARPTSETTSLSDNWYVKLEKLEISYTYIVQLNLPTDGN